MILNFEDNFLYHVEMIIYLFAVDKGIRKFDVYTDRFDDGSVVKQFVYQGDVKMKLVNDTKTIKLYG